MSNFTLDVPPIIEPATTESVVGDFAVQSATADFDSLVARFEGADPVKIEKLEFERDLLKHIAGRFIGSDVDLLKEFHGKYRETFSQLNKPVKTSNT